MTTKTPKTGRGITYGELERLLLRWGFRRERSSQFAIFQHAEQDALIALPQYDPRDRVAAFHLAGIRKQLDERGIVEREAFDRQTHALRTSQRAQPARPGQRDVQGARSSETTVGPPVTNAGASRAPARRRRWPGSG
jgi:hypothetical protein